MKKHTKVVLKAVGLFLGMNLAMWVGHFFSRWTAYRRAPKGSIVALELLSLCFAVLYYLEARRD